jgi:hypothetical protein
MSFRLPILLVVLTVTMVVGAGTASGTVLCKLSGSSCPMWESEPAGTGVSAELVSGTKFELHTAFGTIECSKSTISGETTNAGGPEESVEATIKTLTLEECTCLVKVLKTGSLTIDHISSTTNGTLTSSGIEITTLCTASPTNIHCIYETSTTDLGTVTGGSPAKLVLSASVPRQATDPACAEKAELVAEYKVISPSQLYIQPSLATHDVLCKEEASLCTDDLRTGSSISGSLKAGTFVTVETPFGTIGCFASSFKGNITNTGAPTEVVKATLESLTFEKCTCEFKVLNPGTLEIQPVEGSVNGTVKSSGLEFTTKCSEESTAHCIYRTENTDLGPLEAGKPAIINASTQLSHVATDPACEGEAEFSATYKVSPEPLYVELSAAFKHAVLCTEAAAPCAKDVPSGTEVKASLAAGTKAVMETEYGNIECKKSSASGKTTNTGSSEEEVGGLLETLTFQESGSCEVTVVQLGTLSARNISGTSNGMLRSSSAYITTKCPTFFWGSVHCIYVTEGADLGVIKGGNPAVMEIAEANIPQLSTSSICANVASLSAKYEVTSPKPLYIEPS